MRDSPDLPAVPPVLLPSLLDNVPLPAELPPVVVTAFTRPDLLCYVLDGVKQQTLMPPKIVAFIDGSRKPEDDPRIQDCISLLEAFNSIVPVDIIQRQQNLGCDQNVIQGFTEVFESHETLIYLEDDDVPTPCFYDRMCRLLEAYRDHTRVFSVNAYANFPENFNQQVDADFMVSYRFFSWGFGTWRDRWTTLDLKNQAPTYNPFGDFYKIPATVQTKLTMVNQFFLEKNKTTDWVITMTVATRYLGGVHITPMKSFIRNIGFGHPEAKTYRGSEPLWVNANYDESFYPNQLPSSLEPMPSIASPLSGEELVQHISKHRGIWLTPSAMLYFLKTYGGMSSAMQFFQLFLNRMPTLMRRWRKGMPI